MLWLFTFQLPNKMSDIWSDICIAIVIEISQIITIAFQPNSVKMSDQMEFQMKVQMSNPDEKWLLLQTEIGTDHIFG